MPALTFLFVLFFTELFNDYNFALKVFALLTLLSFIKNHVGTGPLGLALMIGMGWFIFFDAWAFFGGVFVLYTLMTMGISGVFIDFFFVGQQHIAPPMPHSGGGGGGFEAPKGTQADITERNRHHAGHRPMHGGG